MFLLYYILAKQLKNKELDIVNLLSEEEDNNDNNLNQDSQSEIEEPVE